MVAIRESTQKQGTKFCSHHTLILPTSVFVGLYIVAWETIGRVNQLIPYLQVICKKKVVSLHYYFSR